MPDASTTTDKHCGCSAPSAFTASCTSGVAASLRPSHMTPHSPLSALRSATASSSPPYSSRILNCAHIFSASFGGISTQPGSPCPSNYHKEMYSGISWATSFRKAGRLVSLAVNVPDDGGTCQVPFPFHRSINANVACMAPIVRCVRGRRWGLHRMLIPTILCALQWWMGE